ncbi:MAG: hypothetical protein IKJ15_04965 [Lachnospiraceae bacterium]|nr:hypothetical protein [Lachnospiraceae bacterium]
MAFCPVCKCEYKEGIKKCADCDTLLVDSLEEKITLFAEEPVDEEIKKIVPKDVLENKNINFLDRDSDVAAVQVIKKAGVYRDSKELFLENKSSAYMLLTVGIIGIIVLALICTDVIKIYFSLTSKIISGVVMGSLFVTFIVMGIATLKNAKKYGEKAKAEGDLTTNILDYCADNLTPMTVDRACKDEEWDELSEEMKYFKRIDYIKDFITGHFMNLEEDYVSFLADEMYTTFYDDEEV